MLPDVRWAMMFRKTIAFGEQPLKGALYTYDICMIYDILNLHFTTFVPFNCNARIFVHTYLKTKSLVQQFDVVNRNIIVHNFK